MNESKKVLAFFAWLALAAAIALSARFFYLQIIRSAHFQEAATKQRVKEIVQLPERGTIYDSKGSVLAMSLMAQDINVYPNLITTAKQQQKVAKLLADNLHLSYDAVLKKVQSKAMWADVAKRVDPVVAQKIKDSGVGGIEIVQSPKRYYPNGSLASNMLGFVNFENQPGAGLEIGMNSYLGGVSGYTVAETDNTGKVIPVGFENITSPIGGQDVHLTVDSYIQYVLEKRMKQAMDEVQPQSAFGIVMNPKNGEIYAMASLPDFNPNEYQKSDPSAWSNSPLHFTYEPGSTFKPIYMANALEAGAVDENTQWYDGTGFIRVNGTSIRNDKGEAVGQLTLKSIITHSSNVGMVHISQQVPIDAAVNGLKKAGFGKLTGVPIPGEEMGLFPSAENLKNDPLRRATIAFGQGVSVTPLQLITGFSQVINGGHKIQPQIIKEVDDQFGNILYKPQENVEKDRLYSQRVSDLMKSFLKANMTEGSGKTVQLDGYDAGGKTGTAWVVENGMYKSGAIIGSFIGFAPYDDPQIVTLIVMNQPKKANYGVEAAGPTWRDVMTEALRYMSVPKNQQKPNESIEVPDTRWMLYDDAKNLLENQIPNVVVSKQGAGEVADGASFAYRNGRLEIALQTKKIAEGNILYMPKLAGRSKDEIAKLFDAYHIKVKFHGEGVCAEQSLKEGVRAKPEGFSAWLKKEG